LFFHSSSSITLFFLCSFVSPNPYKQIIHTIGLIEKIDNRTHKTELRPNLDAIVPQVAHATINGITINKQRRTIAPVDSGGNALDRRSMINDYLLLPQI
jgi:hypothetical protein